MPNPALLLARHVAAAGFDALPPAVAAVKIFLLDSLAVGVVRGLVDLAAAPASGAAAD